MVFTETTQGSRPQCYAQEPFYNTFDTTFLGKLGIMKVDSPRGWELVTDASFTFCPGAEIFVSMLTIERNPAFYLGQSLRSKREGQFAERLAFGEHRRHEENIETLDKYMACHNCHNLSVFDVADRPLHDLMLYSQKPLDES